MKILNKIVTVLFALELILSIAICVFFMWIDRKNHRKYRRTWARSQKFFIGYKDEKIGEFNPQAQMLIINHQSMLDIMALEDIHPADLCWIAKKEIGEIPILGKILSLPRMIPIDRNNPRAMPKIIDEVRDRISNGRVLAMFPEGTRGDGRTLLNFHSGAKLIANKLELKVQPIVIVGSRDILDTKNFRVCKGKLKIICLDLVDTSEKDWLNLAREKMQRALNENL